MFNRETTFLSYKSIGKQYGLLYILNHSTLSPSELIQVFLILVVMCMRAAFAL